MVFVMQTLNNFEYHGKKAKIGGLCFDESDRLHIFVTYCENCRGKVIITRSEAAFFAKRYNQEQNKIRTRIAKLFLKKF
jgi:hypothetical protein